MCARSPVGQPYPGLHQKQRGQEGDGGDSAPLLPTGETPIWSPASSSGALGTRKTWTCWSGSRGGHKNDQRDGTPSVRKGCIGVVQKRRLWGDLIVDFQYLKGAYKKDRDRLLSRACCDRTRDNGFKLEEGIFRLCIRQKFFTMRVMRHWHRLPREVVDVPSLETLMVRLDRALSNLMQLKMSLLTARGLD